MLIDRSFYTDRIMSCIDNGSVKILTGVRRVGKTSLLKLVIEKLQRERGISEDNIIFISFDYNGNEDLSYSQVYSDICEMMVKNEKNYVFLDEVQSISSWKTLLLKLHQTDNCEIFAACSGFNASSIEMPTRLPFAHTIIHVYPLSYSEYKTFTQREEDVYGYLKHGGFPSLYSGNLDDDEELNVIKDISSSCIYLDIVKRHQIRKADQLDKVFNYLLKNVGIPASAYSVSCSLKFGGKKPDNETVGGYLDKLTDSSLVYRCPRFDMTNYEILKTQEKYYPVDLGLKKTVTYETESTKTELECAVYTELLRRGYTVYVGKYPDGEIKFVAKTKDSTTYIQCSDNLTDTDLELLKRIPDKSANRFAITLSENQTGVIDNIPIISAEKFLSQSEFVMTENVVESSLNTFTETPGEEEFIPIHLL